MQSYDCGDENCGQTDGRVSGFQADGLIVCINADLGDGNAVGTEKVSSYLRRQPIKSCSIYETQSLTRSRFSASRKDCPHLEMSYLVTTMWP